MRSIRLSALLFVALVLLPISAYSQTTWIVDQAGGGDFLTIQEGINAALDGDTVLVKDGTYTGANNKNLDFGGKEITVGSENGADVTIIDCQHDGRGFYFHSGETSLSIVRGFTITNGYWTYVGGIECISNSGPTIQDCIITNSNATGGGGNIYTIDSSPLIRDSTISGTLGRE